MTTFNVEIDATLAAPISDDRFGDAVDSLWDTLGSSAVFASDHPAHVRAVLLVDGADEPEAFLAGLDGFVIGARLAGLRVVRLMGFVTGAPS